MIQASLFAEKVAPSFPGRPCLVKIAPQRASRWGDTPEHGGIVGKVITLPSGAFGFFTRQRGTKPHRNSGCPFPVDDLIARWTVQERIGRIITHDPYGERLLVAESRVVQHAPAQVYDGTLVHLLPQDDWQELCPVEVRQVKGTRHYVHASGRVLIIEPYLKMENGDPEIVLFDPEEL